MSRPESRQEDTPVAEVTEGQCDCACQGKSNQLSIWMHITDACNLNCSYCYLPHVPEHMSLTTGCSVLDSAICSARLHGYQALKIKYAGGEPLLRLAVLLELHAYAMKSASQHNLSLDGVVLTNGTLLDRENTTKIGSAGLRLMVSIDGIGAFHDCQRLDKHGRGSFDRVARGIQLAQEAGLLPELSITVSRQSIGGLPDLISWILERDLPFSINFYRKNERSMERADLDLEERAIIDGMLAAFQRIESHLPRRSLLAALVDRANLSTAHRHPCAAGHDYLVFDPAGQIALCQMQLGKPVSSFQAMDPLLEIRRVRHEFHNPSVDWKSECQSCKWRYFCAGGCPLQAHQASGSFQAKSPNCHIYQALFPEVLRLESLRLAKWGAALGLHGTKQAGQSGITARHKMV